MSDQEQRRARFDKALMAGQLSWNGNIKNGWSIERVLTHIEKEIADAVAGERKRVLKEVIEYASAFPSYVDTLHLLEKCAAIDSVVVDKS